MYKEWSDKASFAVLMLCNAVRVIIIQIMFSIWHDRFLNSWTIQWFFIFARTTACCCGWKLSVFSTKAALLPIWSHLLLDEVKYAYHVTILPPDWRENQIVEYIYYHSKDCSREDFFNVFERRLLSSPRLHLFIKNTVKTVILWNIITI